MGLKVADTKIPGLYAVEGSPIADVRGSFARLFCADELGGILGDRRIVQVNQSKTNAIGAVRGLHFQHAPRAEMKFIRCLRGKVWDVALDLRAESPSFMQWHAQELSGENNMMMAIPEGCAHGFQVLEEKSELLYLHTEFYDPASEGAVRYNDPLVNISWPLPVADLSARDAAHPLLDQNFKGL
jgi:dTDP-4-dehydrorhamnose 3,5-epimerase